MHWPKPHRNGDFGYNIGVPTYPDNWKDLATACKQRAGWRCEECGSTERLGAAHVNHDPENPNPELRCLCWTCHSMYDIRTGANHPGKNERRAATRRKNLERKRHERQSDISFESEFDRQHIKPVGHNSGYGLRAYSARTAHKVRIEYLYILFHICCMHALQRNPRRNPRTQTLWMRNYIRIQP